MQGARLVFFSRSPLAAFSFSLIAPLPPPRPHVYVQAAVAAKFPAAAPSVFSVSLFFPDGTHVGDDGDVEVGGPREGARASLCFSGEGILLYYFITLFIPRPTWA